MVVYLGFASSLGANRRGTEKAPSFIKEKLGITLSKEFFPKSNLENDFEVIARINNELANETYKLAKNHEFFITIGGDHTSAIGTWSGVSEAYKDKGDIGLIWIDAHMDAHTPETTSSGNVHGMPLASLLGYGNKRLSEILSKEPKLFPQNIVLIGVRSYEDEEYEFLRRLGVRIYFIDEVLQRGLHYVWQEAMQRVTENTVAYGISFDLDSLDPQFAKAVVTPVPNGLDLNQLLDCFHSVKHNPPVAFEIVEYNPQLDSNLETLSTLSKIISLFSNVKLKSEI